MAIGKRKEFCITSNKTIKKLIPLGKKKLWHTDFEFQNYHDYFFLSLYMHLSFACCGKSKD